MKRDATTLPGAQPPAGPVSRFRPARVAFVYCSLALVLFACLAYAAVSTKSATYDEPIHTAAAYVHLYHGDFSVEPDHPPLWKYWAALPLELFGPPIDARTNTAVFRHIPGQVMFEWPWSVATLYRTPGNDPERIIGAARFMMLLLGVALGAVTALFAYRAAGPVAACVAVTLFALDPNFLAHAPLVKNDVAIALCVTALAYALYRVGDAITVPRVLLVALLCAACVTTKLTGLLAAPIAILALVARALLPVAWPVRLSRNAQPALVLATRPRRFLAAAATCVACALVTYVAIWAVYLFRFNPSPDPAVHYDTSQFVGIAARNDLSARGISRPTPADLAAWRPSHAVRAAVFALDHHLLPESFVEGLLYTHVASGTRDSYLLGECYAGGRWYYFPVALLVKTPLATLGALVLASILAAIACHRTPSDGPQSPECPHPSLWLWVCLMSPALVFGAVTVASGMNIGLRHIFPLYPLVFVAAGVALARAYACRPRFLRPALLFLAVALAAEVLPAYPDYIPFFNAVAGGARGGLRLLSDSNLDWGQDLPLLAAWQREHPDRALSLAYYGTADPAYYHIRYRNLPHGYFLGPPADAQLPTTGVVAVSASILQGSAGSGPDAATYAPLRQIPPTEVLGGSIYLFDLDAAGAAAR